MCGGHAGGQDGTRFLMVCTLLCALGGVVCDAGAGLMRLRLQRDDSQLPAMCEILYQAVLSMARRRSLTDLRDLFVWGVVHGTLQRRTI